MRDEHEDLSKALVIRGRFSCEAFDLRRAKKPADISSQSGMLPPVGVIWARLSTARAQLVERKYPRGWRVPLRINPRAASASVHSRALKAASKQRGRGGSGISRAALR